jgi:hypothetical protein
MDRKNRLALVLVLAVLPLCAAAQMSSAANSPAASPDMSKRTPVLVELFTSEGCSSCPPADALLANLARQTGTVYIIPIEEHVTYWNHEGWTDPYSADEWTQRQLAYSTHSDKSDVYTPEMVVDGGSGFNGSNTQQAQAEIAKAAQAPRTTVSITPEPGSGAQKVTVSVGKLEGASNDDSAEVWLAVAEDGLSSSVTHGENSGHTLQHIGVLRSLHKIGVAESKRGDTTFSGHTEIKLKSNWNRDKLHVIAFVQEKKSHKVLGATSVTL